MTDGTRVLLGHATRSPRWDIFKGLAEPGESFEAAARRELDEETGLELADAVLRDLGVHSYLPGKDLALFAWLPDDMPDPQHLVCRSRFAGPRGMLPELDRFGVFSWAEARERVGRNLARLLAEAEIILTRAG